MEPISIASLDDERRIELCLAFEALEARSDEFPAHMERLGAVALCAECIIQALPHCYSACIEGYDLLIVYLGGFFQNLAILRVSWASAPFELVGLNSRLRSLVITDSLLSSPEPLKNLPYIENIELIRVKFAESGDFDATPLFQVHLEDVRGLRVAVGDSLSIQYLHAHLCDVSSLGRLPGARALRIGKCGVAEADLRGSPGLRQLDFSFAPKFSPSLLFLPRDLRRLEASNAALRFLDLRGLRALVYLDISYNKYLKLERNFVPASVQALLADGGFAANTALQGLSELSEIRTLSCCGSAIGRFQPCGCAVKMCLAGSGIERLDLRNLKELVFLDVSGNPGLKIAGGLLPGCLEVLVARGRSIRYAGISQCKLREFDASWNQEMRFSYNEFPHCLSRLRMAGCRVLFIDLRPIRDLELLDVAYCEYEQIIWNKDSLPARILTSVSAAQRGELEKAIELWAKIKKLLLRLC